MNADVGKILLGIPPAAAIALLPPVSPANKVLTSVSAPGFSTPAVDNCDGVCPNLPRVNDDASDAAPATALVTPAAFTADPNLPAAAPATPESRVDVVFLSSAELTAPTSDIPAAAAGETLAVSPPASARPAFNAETFVDGDAGSDASAELSTDTSAP